MYAAVELICQVVLPALLMAYITEASSLVQVPTSSLPGPSRNLHHQQGHHHLQEEPLDQDQAPGPGLTADEEEIMSAYRQHLDQKMAEYQRELHMSYSEQAREYSHRKKRELQIVDNLYWSLNEEPTIPTDFTIMKHFYYDGEDYVILGYNKVPEGIYLVNAEIYKFDAMTGTLITTGVTIRTYGLADIETFLISGRMYIAVANGQFSATNYQGRSQILLFKPWVPKVSLVQYLSTYGASALEAFIYEGDTYLAVANSRVNSYSRYHAPVKIYVFAGSHFDTLVTEYAFGASDVACEILGFHMYVAITQYVNNDGSYTEGTMLYRMDVETDASSGYMDVELVKWQIIPSSAPKSLSFFQQGGHWYLGIASHLEVVEGVENQATGSPIYWFATDEQFIHYQDIPTDGAMQMEYIDLEFDPNLLIVADLTGVQFYHFGDDASWEKADTDLYVDDPSTRLTDIHIETFNIDNVDYLAAASASFWTTEYLNLTMSNLFSFSHVNESSPVNVSAPQVYLPDCAHNLTILTQEKLRNASEKIEELEDTAISTTTDETQYISSTLILSGHVKVPRLRTHTLEVTSGQDYNLDPTHNETIIANAGRIDTLEFETPEFVTKSTAQTIEGPVTLDNYNTLVSGGASADSFTADDGLVNGINLAYIESNALRFVGDQTMSGYVTLEADLTVGSSVTVQDLISDIDVPDDVMDLGTSQNVAGLKTFSGGVNLHGNVDVAGTVNGLDLNTDVVLTSRSASIAGVKTFSQGITLSQPIVMGVGKTVDTVDISEFSTQVLSISNGGTLEGDITFESPLAISGDVLIWGSLINGVDFTSTYNDAVFVDTTQTITANKNFQNDLISDADLTVGGSVNDVDISEDVFTKSGTQTINTRITVGTGGVEAEEDVIVLGTVNNVDLSEEAVLVNAVQTIDGLVVFKNDIQVNGNTEVPDGVTIDGVDVSLYAAAAVRIDQPSQVIGGAKTFTSTVAISGDVSVSGDINGVDIEDLYDDVLSISRAQSFDVAVDVASAVEISGDATLESTIDGLNVPGDFVQLDTTDSITGDKTFTNLLYITGNLDMADTKTVNGEDLSAFDANVLKDTGNQNLATMGISFDNPLTISGDLSVTGSVNSYTVPDDLVLLAGSQTILNRKTFDQASLSVTGDVSTVDLFVVDGTVDGVDIDLLYSDALMVNQGDMCVIAGAKTFPTLEVAGAITVDGLVDGVDLATLDTTAVKLTGAHTIAGDKTFSSAAHFEDPVTVTNNVNGVDFGQTASTVIYYDIPGDIRGAKTLAGGLSIGGDLDVDGLVNGVDITVLDNTHLSKQYAQTLSGAKSFTQHVNLANLQLDAGKLLDTIDPSNFLLLGNNENINQAVEFRRDVDVTGDLTVGGDINTVDIQELAAKTVRLSGSPQVVSGIKSFPDISVHNHVDISGLVDGVDVSDLSDRVLRYDQDNDISVSTVISGDVTVTGNLQTEADTGGVDLGALLIDAVLLDEDFDIEGTVVFSSTADVSMSSLDFEEDLDLKVDLDQTTLYTLLTDTIRVSTDQDITSSISFDEDVVMQDCLTIQGTTDTIDLSEHAVLKNTPQTISGCTRFRDGFRVNGDLTVGGTVDDVNLANLMSSRVTYSTEQTITGTWAFDDVTVEGDLDIDGTLNEIDVGDDLVTIYDNEVITGTKDFTTDIVVTADLITDVINDVNIIELSNKVVLTEGPFSIDGEKTFESELTMEVNADVTGLVNCVDVGLLTSNHNTNTDEFYAQLSALNGTMKTQCEAAASMQSSLGEHPLLLTHWVDEQEIDNPAAGKFHSVTLADGSTLLGLAETYNSAVDRCIGTELYLCPAGQLECLPILDEKLPEATDIHLYEFRGDTYIVLLPSQQSGQCDQHQDERVKNLFILKLNDAYYNETLYAPHAISATMFEIDGELYLAVADNMDVLTHSTDVDSLVYRLDNTTGEFLLFQEIPTHGAFSVDHLTWKGKTWICFANNVLDNKSPIYEFDPSVNQFVEVKREGTNHASHVSFFLVGDVPFVAISSEKLVGDQREVEFHREITILMYTDDDWILRESIPTYGVVDVALFSVDDFLYLMSVSLEAGELTIFEWHHAGMFELYQTVTFTNELSGHAFIHDRQVMMALARPAFTSVDIFSWKSKILRGVIRGATEDTRLRAW